MTGVFAEQQCNRKPIVGMHGCETMRREAIVGTHFSTILHDDINE
jgi:hypothetical protein